jgi:hypothetical protein
MSERQEGIRFSQVLAGALAAVTAALIGSTMGVAGTVVGAGLASVISTVGGTLYLRSIQRTKESVRTVRAKVVGRSGGATVLVSTEDPEDPAEEAEPGEEIEAEPSTDDRPPTEKRRLRWAVLAVTTLAAFALGMLAVTGVEWLRGESLSGDGATTFGSIVAPHHDSGSTGDPADSTTSTTTPSPTTSTTTDPTTSTAPTTTSTTPPSDSSTTTTTTSPPATTTTTEVPEQGAIPPSN